MKLTNKPKTQLEIERKFLLCKIPKLTGKQESNLSLISQFYTNTGRYREVANSNKKQYVHTIKKEIKPGVYKETERLISKKEFETSTKKFNSFLMKRRYKIKIGKVNWDIDSYRPNGMCLVVAEAELPSEKHKLKIPKFIKDVLIMEVTQFPEFKNSNLAKIRKK